MGGGGQECPSGASAQQAADVGAVGAESQCATVQQHEAPSNAESYDLTVSWTPGGGGAVWGMGGGGAVWGMGGGGGRAVWGMGGGVCLVGV